MSIGQYMTVQIGYGTERHNAKHDVIVFNVLYGEIMEVPYLYVGSFYDTIQNIPVYCDCTEGDVDSDKQRFYPMIFRQNQDVV